MPIRTNRFRLGENFITGGFFRKDPSLALYLPFWKLNGGSFPDQSGYGHLCTVYGATWGIQGRTFDGTDDRITAALRVPATTPTGLTVLIWFKRLGNSGGSGNATYHQLVGGINGDSDQGVNIVADGTGLYPILAGVAAPQTISDPTSFNQVGVKWNGTNMTPFVNGVFGTSVAAAPLGSGVTTLRMGWLNSTIYITNGIMGEILIYIRAFTASEIQHNYLAAKWRYQ